jgi:Tfp pilus assembly protein PilX
MKSMISLHRQRGVTLIVGLIMLVLITLMVVSAFTLSGSNLRSVGNMQFRNEAIAAANVAIERVISADFTTVPAGSTHNVDLDNDGTAEYTIIVLKPLCIKSTGLTSLPSTDPDAVKCTSGSGGAVLCYDTVWEISATVSTASGAGKATGAVATAKQGISKRVNVTGASSCA